MAAPVRSTVASLRVFLEQIIDYAGLFPPASLDMMTSVNHYSRYLSGPQSWALGRFVIPVARLDEFLNAQENVAVDPWRLSGIISANVEADLAAVDEFNRKAPGAVIDSVEVRVRSGEEIEFVQRNQPVGTTAFFEIAPEATDELLPIVRDIRRDMRGSADERTGANVHEMGACAKLRTGGVVKEAFPSVEQIAEFVARCAQLGVPFKATAGLHHPLRSVRPLTYEPKPPEGTMHGFLNLFTAAAIAWSAVRAGTAVPRSALAGCMADGDRTDWHFGEDALIWRGREEPMRIELECLRAMRSQFALSFGSCSFEEPIRDLHELDLL
jgi:hypothetical protein